MYEITLETWFNDLGIKTIQYALVTLGLESNKCEDILPTIKKYLQFHNEWEVKYEPFKEFEVDLEFQSYFLVHFFRRIKKLADQKKSIKIENIPMIFLASLWSAIKMKEDYRLEDLFLDWKIYLFQIHSRSYDCVSLEISHLEELDYNCHVTFAKFVSVLHEINILDEFKGYLTKLQKVVAVEMEVINQEVKINNKNNENKKDVKDNSEKKLESLKTLSTQYKNFQIELKNDSSTWKKVTIAGGVVLFVVGAGGFVASFFFAPGVGHAVSLAAMKFGFTTAFGVKAGTDVALATSTVTSGSILSTFWVGARYSLLARANFLNKESGKNIKGQNEFIPPASPLSTT